MAFARGVDVFSDLLSHAEEMFRDQGKDYIEFFEERKKNVFFSFERVFVGIFLWFFSFESVFCGACFSLFDVRPWKNKGLLTSMSRLRFGLLLQFFF